MIKIISDGTPRGTHVFNESGEEIKNIVSITFSELRSGQNLCAKLEFYVSELDVVAENVH